MLVFSSFLSIAAAKKSAKKNKRETYFFWLFFRSSWKTRNNAHTTRVFNQYYWSIERLPFLPYNFPLALCVCTITIHFVSKIHHSTRPIDCEFIDLQNKPFLTKFLSFVQVLAAAAAFFGLPLPSPQFVNRKWHRKEKLLNHLPLDVNDKESDWGRKKGKQNPFQC